jgi:DnaJ-class molecular chaperone
VCGDCEGRGETIPAASRCKTCKGKRTVKEKKIIEVTIDKGTPSDFKKIFYGEVSHHKANVSEARFKESLMILKIL